MRARDNKKLLKTAGADVLSSPLPPLRVRGRGGEGGGWQPPLVVRSRIKTPEDTKSETKSTCFLYSFFIA